MPERTVEIPAKTIGAILMLLLSALISMGVYIWNDHIKDYETMKRVVDVLAGGNPYK